MKTSRVIAFASICMVSCIGCVSSPYLAKNADERLRAVDSVVDQKQLALVALDYCTKPYQEIPTGCQMDVRVRALERLEDRDMLLAIASCSIVKTEVKKKVCYVTLGEPNATLREMAIEKLVKEIHVASILRQKNGNGFGANPFDVNQLMESILGDGYTIAGAAPNSGTEEAWLAKVKCDEKVVANVMVKCIEEGWPVDLCKCVYELLPNMQTVETQDKIKKAYKMYVSSVVDVDGMTHALMLPPIIPFVAADADINEMFTRVSAGITTIEEFKAFSSILNEGGKKYVNDENALLRTASLSVVNNLSGMPAIASFANILKELNESWISQLGIDASVRKCAADIVSVEEAKEFASQMNSFNTLMIPDKQDVMADVIIAVLNNQVSGALKGKDRRKGKDGKIIVDQFVSQIVTVDASLLNDRAILAIMTNPTIVDCYSAALKSDNVRDKMLDEAVGLAMQGGIGNMFGAAVVSEAAGEKESPKYTQMYAYLIPNIKSGDTFISYAKVVTLYFPCKMLIAEAEKRMGNTVLAKSLLGIFQNLSDTTWCRAKILSVGAKFANEKDISNLVILEPAFREYAKFNFHNYRDDNVAEQLRAVSCLTNPEEIEAFLLQYRTPGDENTLRSCLSARTFWDKKYLNPFLAAVSQVIRLYSLRNEREKARNFMARLSKVLAEEFSDSIYVKNSRFCKGGRNFMSAIATPLPRLWAGIMLNMKWGPASSEYEDVYDVLSANPSLLVNFLTEYKPDASLSSKYYSRSCNASDKPLKDKNDKPYCPYVGYDLKSPVLYYNCDWFWNTLCKTAELPLSDNDRARLNELMEYVACNAINPDVREKVFNAIVGDEAKSIVQKRWEKAREDMPIVFTELFNILTDKEMLQVKKDKVWDEKFSGKRIGLSGKVVDIGTGAVPSIVIEVAPMLQDKARVAAAVKDSGYEDHLKKAREALEKYENMWEEEKEFFIDGMRADRWRPEKKYSVQEYYKKNPIHMERPGPEVSAGTTPEEAIANQRKYIEDLEARGNIDTVRFSILCTVQIPQSFKAQIEALDKGDFVMLEGYPEKWIAGGNRSKDYEVSYKVKLSDGRLIKK